MSEIKGDYDIEIIVRDKKTEEVVGRRSTASVEIAQQILGDAERHWIPKWDEENYADAVEPINGEKVDQETKAAEEDVDAVNEDLQVMNEEKEGGDKNDN